MADISNCTSIIIDDDEEGGICVRMALADGSEDKVGGFATLNEARTWIDLNMKEWIAPEMSGSDNISVAPPPSAGRASFIETHERVWTRCDDQT
jgi:hypothetical protein